MGLDVPITRRQSSHRARIPENQDRPHHAEEDHRVHGVTIPFVFSMELLKIEVAFEVDGDRVQPPSPHPVFDSSCAMAPKDSSRVMSGLGGLSPLAAFERMNGKKSIKSTRCAIPTPQVWRPSDDRPGLASLTRRRTILEAPHTIPTRSGARPSPSWTDPQFRDLRRTRQISPGSLQGRNDRG